ncbi:MAG: hypothetical protein U9P72_10990 [Campylobacterota bacterium]|nr:hypothetical protein [Campylobacterota bacterium]
MKIIITFLLLTLTNLIALDITLIPYMAHTSYQDSSKQNSSINGFYTNFKEPSYSVELNYENKSLDYNSSDKKLKQTDYTVAYSYLIDDNYRLKTAYHQLSSNAEKSSKAKIYFAGLQYFKKNRFDLGVDISYSSYDKTALATDIYQAKPYFGITFGDYKSTMGKYVVKINTNLFYPKGGDSNSTYVNNSSSYSISIKQFKGDFHNMISAYKGEELFAVKDNGFSVNNQNELYTTGYTISTRYTIDEDMGLKLSYTNEIFRDIDIEIESKLQRYLVLFDYTIR